MQRSRPLAALLLCLSACIPSYAQQVTLSQIKFAGDPTHTQAELLAFTALKPGPTTRDAIEAAANHLGDTGLFDEVNFEVTGAVLTYNLKPAPAATMLPIRFTNFPWWDDSSLDATLQKQVPLYRGTAVPLNGNLRDTIAAALRTLVAAKGVPDPTVSSVPAAATGNHPDAVAFTIDSPHVLIHSLTLAQASPAMFPKLQRPIADITGQQWDEHAALSSVASRLGDAYRNEGYLDIAVTKLDRSAPTITPASIDLDLTATLSEGPQYHVSDFTWAGSPILSTADFSRLAPLKPGAPASSHALRDSLLLVTKAYSAHGYIQAKVDAPAQINRFVNQVAYTVTVDPGPQFHLKALHWVGLPDPQQKDLESKWRMKPGDVYDATYPQSFLAEHPELFRQNLKPMASERANPDDQTVDLTLTFGHPATLPPQ